MGRTLTEEQARARLRLAVDEAGSGRAWAAAHELSPQHVSDVLRDRRAVGPAVAAALGLRPVRAYLPLAEGRRA